MTDIDAIRRKHEAQVAYTKEKQGNFPYLFQSIQSNLRISDVDALFAALDEANRRHRAAVELDNQHLDSMKKALDSERGKVGNATEWVQDQLLHRAVGSQEMKRVALIELHQILKGGRGR